MRGQRGRLELGVHKAKPGLQVHRERLDQEEHLDCREQQDLLDRLVLQDRKVIQVQVGFKELQE